VLKFKKINKKIKKINKYRVYGTTPKLNYKANKISIGIAELVGWAEELG
jgi:hypothetical protein